MVKEILKRAILVGLVLVLSLSVAFVAGCTEDEEEQVTSTSTSTSTSTPASTPQELVIGSMYITDPFTYYGVGLLTASTVFEPLITLGTDGEFKPLLAESWDVSIDGKVYTLYLRKDVKFHDGTPFTANDVKWWIEYMNDTLEYKTFTNVESIEVVDDHTVKIILEEPSLRFIHNLSHYANMVRPLEQDENGKIVEGVGTGPFKLEEYVEDEYYEFVRNDNYWQGAVELEKVTIEYISDPSTIAMALEAGEIDMSDCFAQGNTIPLSDIPRFEEDPSFTVCSYYIRTVYIGLNIYKEPFNDIRVREAVAYALDRDTIDIILGGFGRTIDGPVSPDILPWCNTDITAYPYDLEKAKELLADAGWKDSDDDGILDKDGKPFNITHVLYKRDVNESIAELVQNQLGKVGINVKLEVMESGAINEAAEKDAYDMIGPINDYASSGTPPNLYVPTTPRGPGYFLRQDQELHDLVAKYEASIQKEEQVQLCHEIQQKLMESGAFPIYYQMNRVTVISDKVKNFDPSPGQWHTLRFLWKAHIES